MTGINPRRRLLFALAALAGMGKAHAQGLGGGAVMQIVVGGPPGGLFDIALRIVQERLGRELGRTVVIDNRPGAGGAVALSYVRNAKPDGLTAVMINVSAAANEALIKNRGYDLLADFEPVGLYLYPSNVLIVNPALGARSVGALIEVLKARGSAANYSSGGIGSPGHLAGELFKLRTGVAATHVPYKGAPPAVLAVATGEVDFMFATASAAMGQIAAGKVRALAVTTAVRLPQLPEVPTVMESGLKDFNVSDWAGFLLPKGTPESVRDALHAALVATFSDPANERRLREATFIPAAPALGPAEFRAFLRAEVAKWGRVAAQIQTSSR